MKFNKFNGRIFGVSLSKKEQQALDKEIDRQLAEREEACAKDVDTVVLYTLHKTFGFGATRLRRFWEAMASERQKLVDYYQMPNDYIWLCSEKLKEIGVDISTWRKELDVTDDEVIDSD